MPKAGHGKQEVQQSSELLDPDDMVFLPAAQDVQTELPCVVEYVPATQGEQELTAPVEYLPAGHKGHVSDAILDIAPTSVLNFPLGHARHMPGSFNTSYLPATHRLHALRSELGVLPAGHIWQVSLEDAPTAVENFSS
jgi:hypothetical protein